MVVAELLACALTSTDPFGVTERVVRTRAPECLAPTSACASSACGADAAAPFFAAAPQSAPRLEDASGLRVFFLEGHPGPMNDMMSTLHDVLGVRPDGVEGMVLLQGCIQRNHIDRRFFRCRNCRMGTNVTRQLNQWLSKSKSGRTFCLIGCEKHRCLNAVHDDTVCGRTCLPCRSPLCACATRLPPRATSAQPLTPRARLRAADAPRVRPPLRRAPRGNVRRGGVQLPLVAVRPLHVRQRRRHHALHPPLRSPHSGSMA